jgi:hypothetical protein
MPLPPVASLPPSGPEIEASPVPLPAPPFALPPEPAPPAPCVVVPPPPVPPVALPPAPIVVLPPPALLLDEVPPQPSPPVPPLPEDPDVQSARPIAIIAKTPRISRARGQAFDIGLCMGISYRVGLK